MSKPDKAPQFQFVGSTESDVTEKIVWPIEAQAIVIRNKVVNGLASTAAFEAGVAEYNELVEAGEIEGVTEPMTTELPASYSNKNAGSVLYGLKQRFLKRVNSLSARNHAESLAAAERFGIVQNVPESTDLDGAEVDIDPDTVIDLDEDLDLES